MFDSTLSSEKLATISPDFLILGSYVAGENLNSEAQTLFKAYPSWPASQNQRYCSITDSMYLGPLNALAVSNIAKAAYPGKIK
jgi:iron complex transport system substrate-binding protein